ncbi:MAG TPA: DUF503 domain-containing protein, partial [Anaerolineales bacterium]
LHLPGCSSLKEKRGRLKPLLHRLHREFNISVAEIDQMDIWQNATIACALVSNGQAHTQKVLQTIVNWVESSWPDVSVISDQLEIL